MDGNEPGLGLPGLALQWALIPHSPYHWTESLIAKRNH